MDNDIPVGAMEEVDDFNNPLEAVDDIMDENPEPVQAIAPVQAIVPGPAEPVYGRANGRSNREPQYNARYNQYRRTLGIGRRERELIGNCLNAKRQLKLLFYMQQFILQMIFKLIMQ